MPPPTASTANPAPLLAPLDDDDDVDVDDAAPVAGTAAAAGFEGTDKRYACGSTASSHDVNG